MINTTNKIYTQTFRSQNNQKTLEGEKCPHQLFLKTHDEAAAGNIRFRVAGNHSNSILNILA